MRLAAAAALRPTPPLPGGRAASPGKAAAALEGALPGCWRTVAGPNSPVRAKAYAVNGDDPSVSAVDAAAAVDAALTDQAGSFFHPGRAVSRRRDARQPLPVPVTLDRHAGRGVPAVEECSDPEAQTTWEVTDTELVLHKGVTGRTIDVSRPLTGCPGRAAGPSGVQSTSRPPAPHRGPVTTAPPAALDP
ncbi:MAG: hypothetical protein ACLRWQ_24075 [Flavonifractor plautii]